MKENVGKEDDNNEDQCCGSGMIWYRFYCQVIPDPDLTFYNGHTIEVAYFATAARLFKHFLGPLGNIYVMKDDLDHLEEKFS